MTRPAGYYVLVKDAEVEETSKGGIVMFSEKERQREQDGQDYGVVVAFGPTAFCGFNGVPEMVDGRNTTPEERAACWGVRIGDTVLYNDRYAGKKAKNGDNLRLIQDSTIIGVDDE